MFDWLFDERIRVRVKFVTTWLNYYQNEADTRSRLVGVLTAFEGTQKDKMLYLKARSVRPELYQRMRFTKGGHCDRPTEEMDLRDIEENTWIEFDCWKSTFKRLEKCCIWYCYDYEIVNEEA